MAVISQVEFNDAASTALASVACAVGSIGTQTVLNGTGAASTDGAGFLKMNDATSSVTFVLATTQPSDFSITFRVKTGVAGVYTAAGAVFCATMASFNFYGVYVNEGAVGLGFIRADAGVPTTLGTHATGYTAGTTYDIRVTRNSFGDFMIYRDGALVLGPIRDTTYTSGTIEGILDSRGVVSANQTVLDRIVVENDISFTGTKNNNQDSRRVLRRGTRSRLFVAG